MSQTSPERRPAEQRDLDSQAGESGKPDPWGVKRAENLLQTLQAVLSARVVVSPVGEITEVHVLASSGVSPKQVVRNVESALLAHLGIKVDHRKISVAQTAEVEPIEAGRNPDGPSEESVEKRAGEPVEPEPAVETPESLAKDAYAIFLATYTKVTELMEEGLDPADYASEFLARIEPVEQTGDLREFAEMELWFSAHFLDYASDLRLGRLVPRKVDPEVFVQDKRISAFDTLMTLAHHETMDEFLVAWRPPRPEYPALKALLARLRKLAGDGG